MKHSTILLTVLLLVVATFLVVSCGKTKNPTDSSKTGEGTLVLSITDYPIDGVEVSNVYVKVSAVKVHKAGTSQDSWITVVNGPVDYDLMTLRNVKDLLGNATLEAGRYTQIRLEVTEASIVVSGQTHPLTINSGSVKLVNSFVISEGDTTELVLDFDAEHSVHIKGGAGPGAPATYMMTPVIWVKSENHNRERHRNSARINGYVLPDSIGALVSAYTAGTTDLIAEKTTCIKDGFYQLCLAPGTYDLVISATGYKTDTSIKNLTVASGEVKTIPTVTLVKNP